MKHIEIHFEIDAQCDLRCLHCSSAGNHGMSMGYTVDDIINTIKMFDCKVHVHYTGGEPLQSPNLEEYVTSAHKANADVGLFTSGIKSNSPISFSYGKQLRELGLSFCYFTVYSNSSVIHDRMTSLAGSFVKTIDSIQTLVSLGIKTYANVVIYKENIYLLDVIISFLAGIGITHVRLLRLVKHGNAVSNWDVIGVENYEQNSKITRILQNVKNCPINISIAGFPSRTPCRPFKNAIMCEAGISLMYVTLSGDVLPCAAVKTNKYFKIAHICERAKICKYITNLIDVNARSSCLNEEK